LREFAADAPARTNAAFPVSCYDPAMIGKCGKAKPKWLIIVD
jgi:hypothetical protein